MNQQEIHALADEALNAACALIQDRLGVTDGGLAGVFFSDDHVASHLRAFIASELAMAEEESR